MDASEQFFKVYANLPLNLRDEIICIIDDGPISWRVAFLEISAETDKGSEILGKLVTLEVI